MPYYYHSTQQYTTLTYSLDEYFLSSSLSLRFRENGPVRNVVIIMLKTLHITQNLYGPLLFLFLLFTLLHAVKLYNLHLLMLTHTNVYVITKERKVLRFFSYHEPYTRKPHLEDNNNNNNSLWKQEQARWWIKCCRHYNTRTDQTISSFLYQVLSLHTLPSSHESSAQTKEKLNFIPLCKTATSIPPQQPHTAS